MWSALTDQPIVRHLTPMNSDTHWQWGLWLWKHALKDNRGLSCTKTATFDSECFARSFNEKKLKIQTKLMQQLKHWTLLIHILSFNHVHIFYLSLKCRSHSPAIIMNALFHFALRFQLPSKMLSFGLFTCLEGDKTQVVTKGWGWCTTWTHTFWDVKRAEEAKVRFSTGVHWLARDGLWLAKGILNHVGPLNTQGHTVSF